MRFTADNAHRGNIDELDARIRDAVRNATGNRASLRIYPDDSFRYSIASELEARGFINISVPDFVLKGDVDFEWES